MAICTWKCISLLVREQTLIVEAVYGPSVQAALSPAWTGYLGKTIWPRSPVPLRFHFARCAPRSQIFPRRLYVHDRFPLRRKGTRAKVRLRRIRIPCVSGRSVHAAGPAFAHYVLTPVSVTSTCFAFSNL